MIAELLKRKSPKVKEQKGAAPVSSSSSEDEEEAAGSSDEAEAVDFALGDERARYVLFTSDDSDDFDEAPTAKATAAKAPPAAEPSPRKPRAAKVAANSKFKTAASKVKTTRAAKAFTFPKSFLSTQAINVKHKIGY